jgi:hypothetical protein
VAASIKTEEYEQLRAWSGLFIDHAMPFVCDLSPETHPIAVLDAMAATHPARAREGLALMIGDFVEDGANFPPPMVARLDAAFEAERLPTFSAIKLRFMKSVQRIVKRGFIKTEREYYALRNVVEGADESDAQHLLALLTAFENQVAG